MLLVTASAVEAHELGVVVVVPPGAGGSPLGTGLDGLRLAVDQSPDISHPAGGDAGDHLGGIDVDLAVVASRSTGTIVRRVGRAVSAGAGVLVILRETRPARAEPPVAEILERVRTRNPLVAVAGGARAKLPGRLPLPVVLLRDRSRAEIEGERLARFERAFSRRYGRTPRRASLAGYDAGRLVDRLLARLGEGPFSSTRVAAAVPAAERALVAGTAEFVPAADPERDRSSAPGWEGPARGAGIAVAAAVGVLLVVALFRRGRRSRGSRASDAGSSPG